VNLDLGRQVYRLILDPIAQDQISSVPSMQGL